MNLLLIISLVLIGGGLAGVLFMVGRKIPTLAKLEPEDRVPIFERILFAIITWLRGIKYSSYRPLSLAWLEKNLRKIRVFILRLDNLFIGWISGVRERSQIWTVRSGAWMEHHSLKKKEKSRLLEKLDKAEVLQEMERIKKEVAKDEDKAFKEKVVNIASNGNETKIVGNGLDAATAVSGRTDSEPLVEESSIAAEEKKCIDLIAQNPKDAEAYRTLGFIYLKQKNFSDARACFRHILKINPEAQEIKNKLDEIKGLRDRVKKES